LGRVVESDNCPSPAGGGGSLAHSTRTLKRHSRKGSEQLIELAVDSPPNIFAHRALRYQKSALY
jgi:hypothetical protein